jgi:hypothetical protein
MLNFASDTDVPPARTRAEIERLFMLAGARRFQVAVESGCAGIQVHLDGRLLRFVVPIPDQNHPLVTNLPNGRVRDPNKREHARYRLERARWRTLLLSIKGRLASIEVGMVTVEEAFLAEVVLPGGRTVAETVAPDIARAYLECMDLALLPGSQPNGRAVE